jgi:hypothetical protein
VAAGSVATGLYRCSQGPGVCSSFVATSVPLAARPGVVVVVVCVCVCGIPFFFHCYIRKTET